MSLDDLHFTHASFFHPPSLEDATAAPITAPVATPKLDISGVNFWYGAKQALFDVNLAIPPRGAMAFIGPSGCGKSTLLMCLNRMHNETETRLEGRIRLDGVDVHDPDLDPPQLRRRFGWVAQKPNPFPWTVAENIGYGPRIHGLAATKSELEARVEECLRQAELWDELKDRLDTPGVDLSGGQQQRLCIARALSVEPEVLLMDEPCGSLDPLSTEKIEQLILELSKTLTIVLITHNMEQAARVAERTAFFKLGRMMESGPTQAMFAAPKTEACRDYLAGRYG